MPSKSLIGSHFLSHGNVVFLFLSILYGPRFPFFDSRTMHEVGWSSGQGRKLGPQFCSMDLELGLSEELIFAISVLQN